MVNMRGLLQAAAGPNEEQSSSSVFVLTLLTVNRRNKSFPWTTLLLRQWMEKASYMADYLSATTYSEPLHVHMSSIQAEIWLMIEELQHIVFNLGFRL